MGERRQRITTTDNGAHKKDNDEKGNRMHHTQSYAKHTWKWEALVLSSVVFMILKNAFWYRFGKKQGASAALCYRNSCIVQYVEVCCWKDDFDLYIYMYIPYIGYIHIVNTKRKKTVLFAPIPYLYPISFIHIKVRTWFAYSVMYIHVHVHVQCALSIMQSQIGNMNKGWAKWRITIRN